MTSKEASVSNKFAELSAIDCSAQIEKKNGLSYLSWAWAVDRLLRHDPAAFWNYGEPVMFGDTMMVSCTVVAFDKPMTMQLPVMDHRNKAIPNPDSFAVNTAMQRCLVKAIALHGLGLYIYAGEDVPFEEEQALGEAEVAQHLKAINEAADMAMLQKVFADAYRAVENDKDASKLVIKTKDARKKALAGAAKV